MICGALLTSVHQESGFSSQPRSCSSSGSQQNAQHHGVVTGHCRGSLDHSRALDSRSTERTTRMCHVLSAPAPTPHSPFVERPHVPILWNKVTRHRGSVTQETSHRPRSKLGGPSPSWVHTISCCRSLDKCFYLRKLKLFFVHNRTDQRGDPWRFLPVLTWVGAVSCDCQPVPLMT